MGLSGRMVASVPGMWSSSLLLWLLGRRCSAVSIASAGAAMKRPAGADHIDSGERLCPRCHRPDCETAAELYRRIVCAKGAELEFWEDHFAYTAKMVFVRGWAGTKTDIEKRFLAAHAATLSPARQRQRARRAEMMRGFAARRKNPTMGDQPQPSEEVGAVSAASDEETALPAHTSAARAAA